MLVARRLGGHKAEIRAEIGGGDFGDELFHRIAFIAKTLAPEIPVEPRLMPRPVRRLVREGGVIGFGALEAFKGRHFHEVIRHRVEGLVAAMLGS